MNTQYIEENMLLSKKTVFAMVGLSDTTIWRMERRGEFPRRKQLSKNRVAWVRKDIIDWINSRHNAI